MRCPSCNDDLPITAKFCPACGTRLALPTADSPQISASAQSLSFQRSLSEGICPKCASTEVYVDDRGLVDASGGITVLNLHDIWHGSSAAIKTYLCATCGYLEFFLATTERLPDIIQTWRRIA